ncbi:MAG: zinc-binding dehydrogenase [Acidobacteriota bacterium]
MTAVRLVDAGHPLQMHEMPQPDAGAGDVLVRVKAAGICHTDAHYRAGTASAGPLPVTLGHEVAGVVEVAGAGVSRFNPGDRVCLHYLATCGDCYYCAAGNEQFCGDCQMIGKDRDGGYAEYVVMPARSVVPLPDEMPFGVGAALMCSSSTCFHALRKARLVPGESVAIFGAGGLGLSAIQLARAFGALDIYAVDINDEKLRRAQRYGAIAVNAAREDPVAEIKRMTSGKGVGVALELVGLPETMRQSVLSLGILGRAVLVGVTARPFEIHPFIEVLGKEAEIIGSSDHLLSELPPVLELARRRVLDLSDIITRTVPLDAGAINHALDELERFGAIGRTVIVP